MRKGGFAASDRLLSFARAGGEHIPRVKTVEAARPGIVWISQIRALLT